MNFEELYKKYKDGTATEKEKQFVEEEIEKARAVSSIIDNDNGAGAPAINEADSDTVRRAKKAFSLRNTVRTAIVTVICVAVISGIAVGTVFGIGYCSANKSKNLTKEDATDIAKEYLCDYLGEDGDEFIVEECETELDIRNCLTDSIYVYELEIISGDYSYKVEISAKSGYAVITDKEVLDRDRDGKRNDKQKVSETEAVDTKDGDRDEVRS